MKILVTGRDGQVGHELVRSLDPLGEVTALGREAMDLANPDSIRRAIAMLEPEIIVNAAAYTAVDRAEEETELACAVNAKGPGVLAEEAKRLDALLLHYSTDYVFDGEKSGPYAENDPTNPLGAYGLTKLEGEQHIAASGCRHLILRTSWVYSVRGRNFLLTMRRLAAERPELSVVDDQYGAPTSAPAIADATNSILRLVMQDKGEEGLFHLTAEGRTSWYEFARLIVAHQGSKQTPVKPISSDQYPTPARRPRNSCLDNEKLRRTFGVRLDPWDAEAVRILDRLG